MLASINASDAAWHWPEYARALAATSKSLLLPGPVRQRLLRPALAASYIEWRYYSILSNTFHGIVGLALVNPRQRFLAIAESGLLLILAGVFDDADEMGGEVSREAAQPPAADHPHALCWMHLFPTATCGFDQLEAGSLVAADKHCRLTLRQQGPATTDLRLETDFGLHLRLTHAGLAGTAIDAVAGQDLNPLPGCHWVVHCPSPVALTSGEIRFGPEFEGALAEANRQGADAYAPPALLRRSRARSTAVRWQNANGYYEHSFGIQPLPLFGWDFLFVPDADRGQSLVMQTYRGSRQLRYVEVCWRDGGQPRYHRFDASQLSLHWSEQQHDPVLGATRPLRRLIRGEAPGLRLRLDNRVLHRIPLLRSSRLAVRHFFISEEIGVAHWTLSDDQGQVIAEASNQPCGGELAHFRWRTPTGRGRRATQ